MIHLAFIDADTGNPGNDAFSFVAGATTDIVADSITWHQAGGNTIIQGDVDGDTDNGAELYIVLLGEHTLQASDFILL